MSETESSLSRFTANAAGVQSHEVGLKVKAAGKREQRKSSLLLCRAGAGSSARVRLKVKGLLASRECKCRRKKQIAELAQLVEQLIRNE